MGIDHQWIPTELFNDTETNEIYTMRHIQSYSYLVNLADFSTSGADHRIGNIVSLDS